MRWTTFKEKCKGQNKFEVGYRWAKHMEDSTEPIDEIEFDKWLAIKQASFRKKALNIEFEEWFDKRVVEERRVK